MSMDILEEHLEDIRSCYQESRKARNRHNLNTAYFMPVCEIIRKIGLEPDMLEVISRHNDDSRSITPFSDREVSRRVSTTPASDQMIGDNSMSQGNSPSRRKDYGNYVFEHNQLYYIDEDKEIQKEVERFNKQAFEDFHSQSYESEVLSANGIAHRNKDFLDKVEPSFEEDSYREISRSFDNLVEAEKSTSDQSGFGHAWVNDLLEEHTSKGSTLSVPGIRKFNSVLYDLNVHRIMPHIGNMPEPDTSSRAQSRLSDRIQDKRANKIQKLQKEEYYYKAGEEVAKGIAEKKKNEEEQQETKQEREESVEPTASEQQEEVKYNPQLLINHIDPKFLEGHGSISSEGTDYGFTPNAFDNKTADLSNEKPSEPSKSVQKQPATKTKTGGKKNKKSKKSNAVLVDDNEDDQPPLFAKPKKAKHKKEHKQAKAKAKEEIHIDDCSEIMVNQSFDESAVNEEGEMLDDLMGGVPKLKKATSEIGYAVNLQTSATTDPTIEISEPPLDKSFTEPIMMPKQASKEPEFQEAVPDSEEKDKKKKKKKAKKAQAPKPAGKDQTDEVNQSDKEKDVVISEVDSVLRRSDHMLSLMLQVLDSGNMSEEIFVDKKRHYTKYVYVADAVGCHKPGPFSIPK